MFAEKIAPVHPVRNNRFHAIAIEISNACAFLWTVVSFVSVLFVSYLRYAVFLQDPAAYHTSLCL